MAPHGKKRKKNDPEARRPSKGAVFVNKGVKYPLKEGSDLDGDEEPGAGTPKTHNTPTNARSHMSVEEENEPPPEQKKEKPKKYNSKAIEIIDHAREPKSEEQEPSPAPKKKKRPASKDSGSDTGSASNTDQEGKAGKPKGKGKDKPKGKGKDKSKDKEKDNPEDEAKDKPKDKSKAKGRDKSKKDSKDSEDESKDKSKDKSKAKGKDKSRKDSKDSEDESKDKSKDKSKAKGKNKSRKDSKESEDESKDKSKDRAKNKSKDRTKDKSKDNSKDKSRDSSKDRAKSKAKKQATGKAKDKSEQTDTDHTDNDTDVSSFPSTRDDDSQLTSEQNETEPGLSTDTKHDITKTEDLTGDTEKTEKTEDESAEWTVSTAPETVDAGTSTPRTRKQLSEEESVTADGLTENQPSKEEESAETQQSKEDPSAVTEISKEDPSAENKPTEGDFSNEIQPSRADASAENQPTETEVSTEIQPSKANTPPINQQSLGSYHSAATTPPLKEIRPSSQYTATVEPAQKRSDKVASGRGSRRTSIQSKKDSVEVIPLKSGSYPLIYTRGLSEETKKEKDVPSPTQATQRKQSEASNLQQTDPSSETKDKSVGPDCGANDSEGPEKEPSVSPKEKYHQTRVQEHTPPVSNSRYSQRRASYSERRRQQKTTAYPQSRYYQSRPLYSERKQQYNSTPYPQARYSQTRPPSYERKWQQNPTSHPQARYSQTSPPYYGREQYETVTPYPPRMYNTKNAFYDESSYQRKSPTFSEIRRQPTRNVPSRTGSTEVIPLKSGSFPLIFTRRLPKNTEQDFDAHSERNEQGLKQAGRSYPESGYGPTSSSYYRPKSEASERKINVSSSKYPVPRDSSVTTWTYRRPKSGSLHSTSLFPDKAKQPSSGGVSLNQVRPIDRQSAKQCAQTCCLQPPNRTAQFSNGRNITIDQGVTPIRPENYLESSSCASSTAPESTSNPSTHKRSYISETCSHSSSHATQTKQKRQIIDRDQPGGRKCAYSCCPEKSNNEKNLHNNHSEEPFIADQASYRPSLGSELFPENKTGKRETASQGETFQSYCTTADSNSPQKKFGTPSYNTVNTHTRDPTYESCTTSTCNENQASCSSTRSAPNVTCNSINRTKETPSCRMDQSSNVPADRTVVPIHYKPMSMLDPKSPAEDGQSHSQLKSLKEINWDSILRDRKKKFKSNDFREASKGAQSYRDRGSKMSKYDDNRPCSCLDTRVRSSSANQSRIPSYGNKFPGLSQQPSRPQRPFLHSGPVSRACPSRSFHYTSESSRQDRSACMESRQPPVPIQPCFSNRISDPKTCAQCPSSTIQNRPSTPLRSFQCQESCREPATRTQNSVVGTPINFNSASVSRTAYRSPATQGMAKCRDQTADICHCRIADIERARREKTQCDCADYKEPPRRGNSSCKCTDPVLNLDIPMKSTDFDQKTIYPKSPRANKDYPISSRSNIRSPREMIINHIPSSGYQSPAGGLTSRRQNSSFAVNPVDSYSYKSCGCSQRSKTHDRTPAGHTVAFNSPQRFSSVGREGISGSCGCSNKEIITGDSPKRPTKSPRSAFSNWWACKCCDHEAYNLVCPDRCNLDKRNPPSPRATSSKTVCYPCLSLKGDQSLDLSGVQSRKGYEQSPKVNPKSPGRTSARSRYELNHSYSPGNYDESARSGSRTLRNCRGCDQQPDSTFTTNASIRQSSVSRANFSQSVFTPNADDRACCTTPRSRRAIYEQSTCRNDSQCR